MAEFIFEIGVEEMPARFVPKLANELVSLLSPLLSEAMVDCDEVRSYATPRRIVAHLPGIALEQRLVEEEVTGPPVKIAYDAEGTLTKAGSGFAKTQGVAEADLYTLKTDKGEYLAARKKVGGGKTIDVLPELCIKAVSSLTFPKKMHWGSLDYHFGRPIRWIVALLDQEVVPIEFAGLVSGRVTLGHRTMGGGDKGLPIPNAADYLSIIREQGQVVIDPGTRAELIREQADKLAADMGGSIIWKESLLDEVVNLVEFPRPILGDIDPSFLELPREVLLTSMEKHQKSFGVADKDGNLLPHFLTVLNMDPENVALVKKGWERVLRARLEDARFFWAADCKTSFDTWLEKLEKVVFIGPIGTMGDKSRRLEKLCGKVAEKRLKTIVPGQIADFAKAGRLAKADLVSEMVIEFDSLQGMMGGIYAKRQGFSEEVSIALYEQYLPAGPDSPVPSSLSGAVLSLSDKADTLAGCFGLKMIPTGANDPYALRRAALGICRIIMKHGLDIDLRQLLEWAQDSYGEVSWKIPPAEALEKIMEFFSNRLRAYFTGKGCKTRVVDAAIGAGFTDVRTLAERIEALGAFSEQPDFEQAVLTFKRAANIIRKQAGEMNLTGGYAVDELVEEAEKALATKLEEASPRFDELWERDDFAGLFGILGDLRPVVDGFFDNVMVMCEDEALRLNRLNMLKALVDQLGRLADFSLLQV